MSVDTRKSLRYRSTYRFKLYEDTQLSFIDKELMPV